MGRHRIVIYSLADKNCGEQARPSGWGKSSRSIGLHWKKGSGQAADCAYHSIGYGFYWWKRTVLMVIFLERGTPLLHRQEAKYLRAQGVRMYG